MKMKSRLPSLDHDEDDSAASFQLRVFALAGVVVFTVVTYALIQSGGFFTSPAGFRNGECTPGALTDSARNGEYTFNTSGVIDLQNEFLVVSRRGARAGDRIEARLHQLDGSRTSAVISDAAEVRDGPNDVVFRVPVYKPAGEGCWRVDVSDGRGTPSYVVEVREP